MLGNDVVDLLDVDARPETFHRRFDERIFAVEERRAIAADARPHALRWAHWGAKEAAYKLARQLDPKFVFSPARLVARFEPALALREIARALGVEAGRLAIGRQGRIPTVELDGRTAEFALSLSHHGRFVAFAFSAQSRGLARGRGDDRGRGDGGGRGERAERGDSRDRAEGVGQAAGAVGCPVGAADTAWMVG